MLGCQLCHSEPQESFVKNIVGADTKSQARRGPYLEDHSRTCRWLVTPIYRAFRPFVKGTTPVRGRGLTNHGY